MSYNILWHVRRRRGASAIIAIVSMLVAVGFVSLGVDWGRVQLAKTELQQAADSASRAAAGVLVNNGVSAAQSAAVSYAASNTVNGSPVTLDTSTDLDFGNWDTSTRTFTVLTGSARSGANAVRVNLGLTAAKGNALPLIFGQVVGLSSCNVRASAIATIATGFGVVGLNYISMSGNSSDSYWAPSGYAGSASPHGSIASNGNITLGGSASIQGDARPGIGKSVSNPSRVSGSTTPLTYTLTYPNGDPGTYATVNDNSQCPDIDYNNDLNINGNHSTFMPGGTYCVRNLSLGNTSDLYVLGPATVYVTGSVNVSGNVHTSANKPANLTLVLCSSNSFSIYNNTNVYLNLYAPQSAVTLGGSGDIYGRVIGLSVTMSGSSAIHYDQSLPGGQAVATVK